MLVAIAGCGGGTNKPTESPFVGASRSTSDRVLLVGVGEGTLDRSSPCWINYAAAAEETGGTLSVRMTARPNDAEADCGGNAVPAYLVVILPRPLDVRKVRDTTSGKMHRIGPAINPSASELIGHIPPAGTGGTIAPSGAVQAATTEPGRYAVRIEMTTGDSTRANRRLRSLVHQFHGHLSPAVATSLPEQRAAAFPTVGAANAFSRALFRRHFERVLTIQPELPRP
jgi:hypothetical protein